MASIVSEITRHAQPALLYLVPCTLLPVFLLARIQVVQVIASFQLKTFFSRAIWSRCGKIRLLCQAKSLKKRF